MSVNTTFGLNLRVLSFDLRKLIKDSDDVRVSITTVPEQNKQNFTISARKMKDCHITFGVNVNIPQENMPDEFISSATEKIYIVFRRKSFFYNDPIIATGVIPAKELPRNLSEPPQTKMFNLLQKKTISELSRKINFDSKDDKIIVGSVQVQMSLTDPFPLKDFNEDLFSDLSNGTEINGNDFYMKDQNKLGTNYFGFKVLGKRY